jgi:hypothetical protein
MKSGDNLSDGNAEGKIHPADVIIGQHEMKFHRL